MGRADYLGDSLVGQRAAKTRYEKFFARRTQSMGTSMRGDGPSMQSWAWMLAKAADGSRDSTAFLVVVLLRQLAPQSRTLELH